MLVWFNSDNGGWQDSNRPDANGVTGGLRGRKGDMCEGGIRVPATSSSSSAATNMSFTT